MRSTSPTTPIPVEGRRRLHLLDPDRRRSDRHVSKDIASDSSFAIDPDGKGAITRVFPELAVGHDIDIQVQVFENDVQSWDWCSGFLTGGKEWDGTAIDMENDCGTWLELHTTYDAHVSSNQDGYGFQETEPIEFEMGSGDSSVHMTITGTVTTVWS
jgi:hypothetical protein